MIGGESKMEPLRHIGIESVPESPWGTHFCLFYRTQQDLLDLLVPYFKTGLENNEFCMWVTSEPLRSGAARQALRSAVKDFDDYEGRGQIEILDYSEWYMLSGRFDSGRVLAGWVEKEKSAVQRGFDGLRLTGNTFWLEDADWQAFIEYEAAVDNVISQYHMLALCTYSLDKCGASEVIDVTNQHQFALAKRAGKWERVESADRRRVQEAQRYAAELEQRVAERTSQLHELNLNLQHENAERQKREKELANLNRTLTAHKRTSQSLMRAEDEKQYLDQACRIIMEDGGHALVWIGFAENDKNKSVRVVASAGFEERYLQTLQLTWADTERGRGPTGVAIRTGKPSGCPNMLTDPRFVPWREEALKRGYASSMVLPLLSKGKALGVLTIYAKEPEAFSEEEVTLLSDLADDLAYGITMLRLRQAHARAESALKLSESRYRSLFESMNEGFALHEILCDEQGRPIDYRFLELNPAFERLTGLKRKEVAGQTARTVLPQLEDFWIDTYGKVALTGEPVHFENYAGPLQQSYEVFAYCPTPGQFAVLFVNITERKQTEDRIRKLNQELEHQAEELEAANVQLEEQAEELRVANTNIEEALAQEHAARAEAEAQQRILEQRERSLQVAMREIERLNRDLEQRAGELEGANKELEAFAYSVSHDLRTPLASMESFARLLAEECGEQLSPEGQAYLRLVRDNTSAMSGLIEGLLSFSRTSRQPLKKQTIQPADVVRQVLTDLCPAQEERPQEIVIGDLPECEADPVLFKQVWVNLLSNAFKFSRLRPTPRIEVGYRIIDGRGAYFVKDNGVGFDTAQLDRLFGVFQRLHSDEDYEGTGVGLAIVDRIIRRHGGRVWAEAQLDKGATFFFTLP